MSSRKNLARPLPRWRTRQALASVLGAAGILALALSGIGGSYAMWNDSATVDAGTIDTGSAGLTAAWPTGHSDAGWSNLLPGESVRRPLTVTNTGAAPMELSASTVGSAGFEIRTAAGTCPASPLAGAAGDGAPRQLGVTLGAGSSTTVCVEVRAAATATPAQALTFSVRFDGKQVPR